MSIINADAIVRWQGLEKRPPKTFFTSDLHFGHKRIAELSKRHLVIPEGQDHTEWLRRLWNKQVDHGDSVIHVGDFFFGGLTDCIDLLHGLNGRIHFILGNHDKASTLIKACEMSMFGGQHKVLGDKWLYRNPELNTHATVVGHYPELVWRHNHLGAFHLHGHCHGSLQLDIGKALDVGLDNAYKLYGLHRFFDITDIKEYMADKEIKVWDHHKPKAPEPLE